MFLSVWQAEKEVTHCLVEAFTNLDGSVGNEDGKVANVCCRFVKLFDWNDMRITNAWHFFENGIGKFKWAAICNIVEGFQACDSDLGMLVDECCKQSSAHVFTKMQKLISTSARQLSHSLASFNYDRTSRIHAQSSANVDQLINVRSQAIKNSRRDQNCDNLRNCCSYFLTVLRRINHNLRLLTQLWLHLFWQAIKTFQVITV